MPDSRYRDDLAAWWEALASGVGRSLSAALGDRLRQSFHSLWARESWTVDDLLAGVYAQSVANWPVGERALVVLDTCFFDFRSQRACRGLGAIGTGGNGRGLCSQAALLVSEHGQPRGLLGLWTWTRGSDSGLPWPADEPESSRWGVGVAAAQERFPGVPMTVIMDAEADIYGLFVCRRRPGVELLVRMAQDRRVAGADETHEGAVERLQESLERQPRVGELVVRVPRRPARKNQPAEPERRATLSVRYERVRLLAPVRRPAGMPAVPMSVVLAREETPPPAVTAVSWCLLSTAPVRNAQEAVAACGRYAYRWRIEQAHRLLKDSQRFERLQLDDARDLSRALALYWPLAARALWLRYEANESPDRPAGEVFEDDELQILQSRVSEPLLTVADAVRAVGRLGGWVGGTKQQLPGAGVLLQGLATLDQWLGGYRLARETATDHRNRCSDTS